MSFIADYYKNKAYFTSLFSGIGTVFFIIVCASTNNTVRCESHCNFQTSYVEEKANLIEPDIFTTFAFGCIYGTSPLVLMWVANTICYPAEKRAVALGLVNALGNTASIYGVFLWPDKDAPRYIPGFRYVDFVFQPHYSNTDLLIVRLPSGWVVSVSFP